MEVLEYMPPHNLSLLWHHGAEIIPPHPHCAAPCSMHKTVAIPPEFCHSPCIVQVIEGSFQVTSLGTN